MTQTWTPDEQREHRKQWVEALRSGKYQQGVNGLRRVDGCFCCLGVACDISGLGVWRQSVNPTFVEYSTGSYSTDSELPQAVVDWLGLSDRGGSMREAPALWQMNDNQKLPFAEIAATIESEPEGLIAKVSA